MLILFISGLLILVVDHCITFNDRVISDKQTEQDVEESGYGLICGTIEELQNNSVRVASLLVNSCK